MSQYTLDEKIKSILGARNFALKYVLPQTRAMHNFTFRETGKKGRLKMTSDTGNLAIRFNNFRKPAKDDTFVFEESSTNDKIKRPTREMSVASME